MTNEEKALAKEQAKQWITKAPEPELVAKPRAHKGKPRSAKTLPKWIYRRHYISGEAFYVVNVKQSLKSKSHHVGSFPTVAEAVRRLAQWLDRQQALERANAAKTTTP